MKQLLVRNVSDEVVERVKRQASQHGRSMQAELRAVIDAAFPDRSQDDWWAEADRLRAETQGRGARSSGDLQRELREELQG